MKIDSLKRDTAASALRGAGVQAASLGGAERIVVSILFQSKLQQSMSARIDFCAAHHRQVVQPGSARSGDDLAHARGIILSRSVLSLERLIKMLVPIQHEVGSGT